MPHKKCSAWNPGRRNKNIGTKDQGFKHRNDFRIPRLRHGEKVYWEVLNQPTRAPCSIGAHSFTIFVEPTRSGYMHHVTVDDITKMLSYVPDEDRRDIVSIVLRQPTKKEKILSGIWGRLVYWAEYDQSEGPAIILEAQPENFEVRWGKSLSPACRAELDRLEVEGHAVSRDRRGYVVRSDGFAIRNTQLYRTLLHEIGHYADYNQKVLLPPESKEIDFLTLHDLYHSRPSSEKEAFAERYAETIASKLKARGAIPFAPANPQCVGFDTLKPEWFFASKSASEEGAHTLHLQGSTPEKPMPDGGFAGDAA